MKVVLTTIVPEEECRKRVEADSNKLVADAKFMVACSKGDASFMRRAAFNTMKATIMANLKLAKVLGASSIDWDAIMNMMEGFAESAPYKIVSYEDGKVLMDFDDTYVQYVGYYNRKFDDDSAKKHILKVCKKVLDASEAVEMKDADYCELCDKMHDKEGVRC